MCRGTMAPTPAYNSAQYKKELQETGAQAGQGGAQRRQTLMPSLQKAARSIEAEYYIPHLAHAPMEPPVAVADYRDGKVTVWTCTQNPQAVQDTVAEQLGIPSENVICHVTLLGGGFGRKSKPDYVAEAAVLSKKVGRPVKVVWSREDDIKFGYYHTVAAMYMKAALDDQRQADRVAAALGVPAHRVHLQGERHATAAPTTWAWDGPTLPLTSPTCGSRMARRKPTCGSDG